jgi:pimeloyl-ACP methyl ester carboxylesterase
MDRPFPDLTGVEHRFVHTRRLNVHTAEAGAGEPVLLLHGWPQHWYLWREVIPLLAPHCRVVCPDLRGFGWSGVPRGGYDRETMAGDVLAVMDALGLERVLLGGHDWGAWIGFLLALRHPDRVERLLACSIVPPWPARELRGALGIWRLAYQIPLATPGVGRGRVGRRIARLALDSADPAMDAEAKAVFLDRLEGERGRAAELLYRTFLLRELGPVAAGRYARRSLEVPTLLLAGDRDPAIPAPQVERVAAVSGGVELELVEGAGHFLVDERPQLVANRARSFLLRDQSAAG